MSRRLRVPAAAHRGNQLGDAPLAGLRALRALDVPHVLVLEAIGQLVKRGAGPLVLVQRGGEVRRLRHHPRFIVELDTAKASRSTFVAEDRGKLPIFTPAPRAGDVVADGDKPASALIEIPWDVQNGSLPTDEMLRWRIATRSYFQWAFLNAYRVSALQRDREAERAFYVIDRDGDA